MKIKTYSNLNTWAFISENTNPLRLYYILRTFNSSGWIRKDNIYKLASEYLFVNPPQVEKIVKQGLNTFWTWKGSVLVLRSVGKIIDNAGVEVLIPDQVFCSLLASRAFFYASFFAADSWRVVDTRGDEIKPAGYKTISREKLSEIFKITKTTQIRYEKIAKIHKKIQYTYSKVNEKTAEKLHFRDNGVYRQRGQYMEDIDRDGEKELVSQTANGYHTNLDARPAPRRFRKSLDNGIGQNYERVFFDRQDAGIRVVSRERRDAFVLSNHKKIGNTKARVFEYVCY